MTPEEKKKLYEAIDYKEGGPIAMYPNTFVENRFDFKLNTLALSVVDDSLPKRSTVLVMALQDVQSQVEQRPSAGGLKVWKISSLHMVLQSGVFDGRKASLDISYGIIISFVFEVSVGWQYKW